MFTISDSQLTELSDKALQQFHLRLSLICHSLEHTVSGQPPIRCDSQTIGRYVEHARRAGFTIERDIARFVILCVFFEGRIPVNSMARAALLDYTINSTTRLVRLYEAALEALTTPSISKTGAKL